MTSILPSQVKDSKLVDLTARHEIFEFYSITRYDYAMEASFLRAGKHALKRKRFLERFNIPDGDELLVQRIMNQVNFAYAERWVRDHAHADVSLVLQALNLHMLYRQGKRFGFRNNEIRYGARHDLDLFDPRRAYNALLGAPGALVNVAVEEWRSCVDRCPKSLETGVVLVLLIIAIHPFSDGNGRIARACLPWLLQRWGAPLAWLREAPDGEFLRVGSGIASTEFLMMEAIADLGDGYNLIQPGFRERFDSATGAKFLAAICDKLRNLCSNHDAVLKRRPLVSLFDHYREHGHFASRSPRFECLAGQLGSAID